MHEAVNVDRALPHFWPPDLERGEVHGAGESVRVVIGAARAVVDGVPTRSMYTTLETAQLAQRGRVIGDRDSAAVEKRQAFPNTTRLGERAVSYLMPASLKAPATHSPANASPTILVQPYSRASWANSVRYGARIKRAEYPRTTSQM